MRARSSVNKTCPGNVVKFIMQTESAKKIQANVNLKYDGGMRGNNNITVVVEDCAVYCSLYVSRREETTKYT